MALLRGRKSLIRVITGVRNNIHRLTYHSILVVTKLAFLGHVLARHVLIYSDPSRPEQGELELRINYLVTECAGRLNKAFFNASTRVNVVCDRICDKRQGKIEGIQARHCATTRTTLPQE